MNIRTETRGGIFVLRPEGALTLESHDPLLSCAFERLGDRGTRLVIDLSAAPSISSAGLSALVQIAARANLEGGRVVLAGPAPFVAGVLALTKLAEFFHIEADVETALRRLGTSEPATAGAGRA